MSSSLGPASVLSLGDVQPDYGSILAAVPVTPTGFQLMSFHRQPRPLRRFMCRCPSDANLLAHEIALRWQTIPKQMPLPPVSGIGFPHGLFQDNRLRCSNTYSRQAVHGSGCRHSRFRHSENN